ncbi:MAG: sulfotransferase [Acetobacteraceae bacterium]|nr:sulfotransferase [Acetobacteraceae bacterium]
MSIATAVLGATDMLADAIGALDRPLEPEPLLNKARRRCGLADLGEWDVAAPLARLLDACSREANLSLLGRGALRWDVLRFASNLLRLRAEEAACPGILAQPVVAPIFITGLPRSGTTFLHRLMMEDPQNRAPRVFETIHPYPDGTGRDRRERRVNRQLRAFERVAPEFRSLHPLDAASPQECCEITAHVFRSLRFDTTYQIPSYRRWLDEEGHFSAYQFHRRFLQHLQHQEDGGRFVLKCPDHLFALRELRAVYPDARVVFVHRDPVKVLLSLTRLTEVLRRPFTRGVDRGRIGREESARWYDGTLRMIQADAETPFAEPICHVHYLDLISDPVSTVESVYSHFGLTLSQDAEARIARLVAARPDGGYGQHSYRFEDHGLDAGDERDRFRGYMIHFGIEPEAAGARPASARSVAGPLRSARTGAG